MQVFRNGDLLVIWTRDRDLLQEQRVLTVARVEQLRISGNLELGLLLAATQKDSYLRVNVVRVNLALFKLIL